MIISITKELAQESSSCDAKFCLLATAIQAHLVRHVYVEVGWYTAILRSPSGHELCRFRLPPFANQLRRDFDSMSRREFVSEYLTTPVHLELPIPPQYCRQGGYLSTTKIGRNKFFQLTVQREDDFERVIKSVLKPGVSFKLHKRCLFLTHNGRQYQRKRKSNALAISIPQELCSSDHDWSKAA